MRDLKKNTREPPLRYLMSQVSLKRAAGKHFDFQLFCIKVNLNIQCQSGFQRKPGGLRMNKRTD